MTPTRPTTVAFADLAAHCGTTLGTSDWRAITQEMIDGFGALTGDRQWIHVDPVRAAADGPFGGTVAHGFLTLALATSMIGEVVEFSGVGAAVNYGCDQVRFTAPVPSGSRVRAHVDLASTRRRGRQFTEVVLELQFEVEGQSCWACTARIVVLLTPEEAAGEPSVSRSQVAA